MNVRWSLGIAGLAVAVCCWLDPAASFAEGVNLAQMQDWDIVVGEGAIPSEQYAAEEFQEYFFQAAGVRLPIVSTVARKERHLFIGPSEAMRQSTVGFDPSGMGGEDPRIVVRGENIAIAGGRPRGTLYGVYQFLEDYLGVRFLTFDHTHVPGISAASSAGMILPPVDRTYHPALSYRYSYYGETNTHPEFAARMRVNTISSDPRLGGKTDRALIGHTFGNQIPTAKYGKEHPEYFAEVDGKRLASVKNDWYETQPCLANPDVLRIVTESVLEQLRANPKVENISISQNDNEKYCRCRECAALDAREESSMGSLLTFVNAAAERVEQEFPGVKVGTLSYQYTRRPPKTVRPRGNVQIQLCDIECCLTHAITDPKCPLNGPFCADMAGWGKICNDIAIWHYNTNFTHYQLLNPNLRSIEPSIRYFVANHAQGVFMQAAGNTIGAEFSDLRNYLMSRLLWNAELGGNALVEEFLTLHYGPAAGPIREYIQRVQTQAEASGMHHNCFGYLKDRGLDPALGLQGIEMFAAAERLAPNETIRLRVEKASICAYRTAIEQSWHLDEPAELTPEMAQRERPLMKRFFELCQKHGVAMVAETTSVDASMKKHKRIYSLKDSESF